MITITGATGKTGSHATRYLLAKGERVRIVGRSEDRMRTLIDKGAEPLVGDQSDEKFLVKAFTGADAAYVLVPPRMDSADVRKYYNAMGEAVVNAVRRSKIPKIVFLSSLGAQLPSGTGPVTGLHDVEGKLEQCKNTDIVFLRAGYFMENILTSLPALKNQGVFGYTMTPDAKVLMVAAKDIGAEAGRLLLERNFKGRVIIDLFGDRISYREITRAIGTKIGKPDLSYIQFADGDALAGMKSMGVSASLAESFVELAHAVNSGLITTTTGDPEKPNAPTKFAQFVDEVLYPAFTGS